ncbi:vesicle-associated membrane protein-like [Tropilaelaps mercedesae]|uniref:Vesicle-associated membrane protein 7 n=1 Tax=Tropilaelaps mercedesae TaxID=418985 RepID=A0A1V9XX66_9ACAR|nr:vesicle-associated membrane protein-like [Tropilaelaps mercedesae]
MQKLEYAAICRGYTVLVSFQDEKGSENAERFKFHVLVQSGVVFACGAVPEAGVRLPFSFLAELCKRFNATSLPARAYNAEEHEFDREFKYVLRETLDMFNNGPIDDEVHVLQNKVQDVQNTMQQNITKALERGARIDDIVGQTEELESQSVTFRAQSARVRRKMWLQNFKCWIIIGVISTIVIVLLGLWISKGV